ncbi:MAG: LLM class flavin-dependent oxidoreductase [Planctomycetes bacterium]|nr:LLM class flavin-dependent oxidoreductase [Planctomycetota bacterium]
MSQTLAAVFVGSDTLLLQCLEVWRERGHRVVAVATDTDKVRRHCAELGLRCLDASADFAAQLQGEEIDLLFAITWLSMLPESALRLPRHFAVNFHDGPLPRYAGLNATCWAIHNGEREHAVTWHVIEAEADTGAILSQQSFAIAPDDTAFTLNARCFEAGLATFEKLTGQLMDNAVTPVPQDLQRRSYFGRRARPAAMAMLDFGQPAAAVARVVRAFDHGGYQNPIAIAKVRTSRGVIVPGGAEVVAGHGAAAGTITAVDDESVRIACADGEVRLTRLRCLQNHELDAAGLQRFGVVTGGKVSLLDADHAALLTALGRAAAADEPQWLDVLRSQPPLPVPGGSPAAAAAAEAKLAVDLGAAVTSAAAAAAITACFLARDGALPAFAIGLRTAASAALVDAARDLAVAFAPAVLAIDVAQPVGEAQRLAGSMLEAAAARGPLLRELLVRRADVLPPSTVLEPPVRFCLEAEPGAVAPGSLVFVFAEGGALQLRYDGNALPVAAAEALARRLQVFARAAAAAPQTSLATVPVLDAVELQQVLHDWNDAAEPAPSEPCVHRQFAAQAARTPDQVALRHGDEELGYGALMQRVARLAGWLRGRGVDRGDRVGICTGRGLDMVTAVLATLRCGAAYVPLDPAYPRERLQFMADDAELRALIVDPRTKSLAPSAACAHIDLEADREAIAAAAPMLDDHAVGDDLAYVIYTSGSTGHPKGVMVRHRNVTNFFAGMDRVLGTCAGAANAGVWLAVTSLSFDISVLELLWTLCRGLTVVVHDGEGRAAQRTAQKLQASTRPITFSMFYFASDEGEHAEDKYRLLLDGARFADEHGFEAVWTPERHFHAFGGLYPNPSVASAAIAAITRNVGIRAGSCVLPLHSPIRIAEEWSLVDNLSHGRVGIAFAAGWHGRDFVLRPETFADRKNVMFAGIEQVKALWRGEAIEFPGHDGAPIPIRTMPRPIQNELPVWITVAGNPETYRQAGEIGAHVLTHLLGQSLEELAQKLDIYRQAWRTAGHPGEGKVTLMLHTFVGDDDERVREIVREPMKGYLKSSIDLVKQAAWSFPAFKNRVDKPGEMDALLNGGLTPADFEALLEFSFERYYRTSGLFGTPESCVQIVDRLRGMQVDEIACLVDFGVPTDLVMANLPKLLELKRRCDAITAAARVTEATAVEAPRPPESISSLLQRHGVTHLQCTPSMAAMLMLDPAAVSALRGVQHMLVGGEALPGALAASLRELVPNLHDVYGPTETTVWSTVQPVGDDDPVPIGRPLANQRVYVLDPRQQPVAIGHAGELWIGGDGVTAGYFRRPELTQERFVPDPFCGNSNGNWPALMYRTGDLARWRHDGVLEYLGRTDHQVKVRGYRIELGEIEAALSQHPGVRECVVTASSEGTETRLCAYFVPRQPAPKADDLRAHLRTSLPEFMMPSWFVALADLPRTPNLKIDRQALPSPEAAGAGRRRTMATAQNETEDAILAIWRQALATDEVGVEDNFFDSGGHSILAVKVHREIVQRLGVELQITDLFRFTTVRALARHLQADAKAPSAAQVAAERAKARRLTRRR